MQITLFFTRHFCTSLVLKVRVIGTRKWPISRRFHLLFYLIDSGKFQLKFKVLFNVTDSGARRTADVLSDQFPHRTIHLRYISRAENV